MKEVKTIAAVVSELDAIVQDCIAKQSRAGYFAALYKRMTMAVKEGIEKGQFENGPRMESFDVIFAQRYLAAYESFRAKQACSSSWECAFGACANRSLIVLQQLLLGINTHINLDLAIAAAEAAPGAAIHSLETDFNRINGVIASLVNDVQRCLEEVWFPMRFLRNVVNKQGQAVLNFSIETARNAAWSNAVTLAGMNENEKAAHIQKMDATVRSIGERIISPGLWPQLLLRFIRLTEWDDTARTIRLIDTTVVE